MITEKKVVIFTLLHVLLSIPIIIIPYLNSAPSFVEIEWWYNHEVSIYKISTIILCFLAAILWRGAYILLRKKRTLMLRLSAIYCVFYVFERLFAISFVFQD